MTAPASTAWHPAWCERGHHCTAAGGGEHAAAPIAWEVPTGRVVVSRHLGADGRSWVEVRHVLRLEGSEARQRHTIRVLVAISAALLREVVRWRG